MTLLSNTTDNFEAVYQSLTPKQQADCYVLGLINEAVTVGLITNNGGYNITPLGRRVYHQLRFEQFKLNQPTIESILNELPNTPTDLVSKIATVLNKVDTEHMNAYSKTQQST